VAEQDITNPFEQSYEPEVPEPAVTALARSVKRLRVWVIVLTVVVSLLVLGSCAPLALVGLAMGTAGMGGPSPSPTNLSSVRSEIQTSLGANLASLQVRSVEVSYPEVSEIPFFSAKEHLVYVEAHLKDPDVVIADVLGFAGSPTESGLLPTKASFASRLSDQQYLALLRAFRAKTDRPVGPISTYADSSHGSADTTVAIDGRYYPASQLWSVTVGRRVSSDRTFEVKPGARRDCLVFWEEPGTGRFEYVGTESVADDITPFGGGD
jgi:hypothetical protein